MSNFPEWILPTIRNIRERFAALGSIEHVKTPEIAWNCKKRKKPTDLNRRSEEITTPDVPA